jgi:hypothetical protein
MSVVDKLDRLERVSGGAQVVLSKRLDYQSSTASDRHAGTLVGGFGRCDIDPSPMKARRRSLRRWTDTQVASAITQAPARAP